MSPLAALAVLAAGLAAGTVNTIVGAGSLITFPTLLALGYSPVVANVSNTIGLVPGALSGSIGYRRELHGQRDRLGRLGAAAVVGGITGGVLLLVLPSSVFDRVVPVLILAACLLVALQPRISGWVQSRRRPSTAGKHHGGPGLYASLVGAAIYGGYFGAAQGVLLIALLAIFLDDHLQRLNAAKNVLAVLVNGVAAVLFVAMAHVAWEVAALLAVGSVLGGQLGASVGRRLPPGLLRGVVVVVGVAVAIRLLV